MSALGQKSTFALHQPMSALPPKADIRGAPALIRSQARPRLVNGRLRSAAALPAFTLFFFQSKTARRMLIGNDCGSSLRLCGLISASVFHIEETMLSLARHFGSSIFASIGRSAQRQVQTHNLRNSSLSIGQRHRHVRGLPPKADICGANRNVRFWPIADIHFS